MELRFYTDEYLLDLLDKEDRRLYQENVFARQRQFKVVVEVCRMLGHTFVIGATKDEFIDRLFELVNRFYRKSDIGTPSIHSGVATHFDLVFRVDVPIIFGSVTINPFKHVDASEWQLKRLNSNAAEIDSCIKQVADVWDIGLQVGAMDGHNRLEGRAGELFDLATFHLQASTATLTQNFALRGAVQMQ